MFFQMKTARVNPCPVIIMGNQKSGTSAIASLLAKATNRSVQIDMFHLITDEVKERLYNRQITFKEFVERYRLYFSSSVIKECSFTFFYDDIQKSFPESPFIFILRDPRDNIRSILNRLNIPGHFSNIGNCPTIKKDNIPKGWVNLLEGKWPLVSGENYIEKLAYRWKLASNIYQNNKSNFILVRYEDFVENKIETIFRLAQKIGLEPNEDITEFINVQYQSKGNHTISWSEFFGENNLRRIEKICSPNMEEFGYVPKVES